MITASPEWTVEQWAGGCTSCGSPTPCPKWIVTGTLSCELYPCRCDDTRRQAYEDHGIEDASCWWRDRKRPGKLASRCPCWGRQRDDRLPRDCCARHEQNPQYVIPDPVTEHMGIMSLMDRVGEDGEPAVLTQSGAAAEAGEAPERTYSAGAAGGPEPAGSTTGYTRRWAPHEVTCDCKTPWDSSTRAGGYHCVACHTNWVNYATAVPHQRYITDPCRTPQSIVDIDTGRALLYPRDVRGMVVWAFAW